MKTLDEVIKAMESCNCHDFVCHQCPYYDDDDEVGCRSDDKEEDALHYLKEYREKLNILRGKWQITSIKGETWGICSNCNFKQKAGELNFCPNCGADMREDIPIEYFENGGI